MSTAGEERERRKKLTKVKTSKAVRRSKNLIAGSRVRIARTKALAGVPPKSKKRH
jgi:hypothetical protein